MIKIQTTEIGSRLMEVMKSSDRNITTMINIIKQIDENIVRT